MCFHVTAIILPLSLFDKMQCHLLSFVSIDVPAIDEIINWAQKLRNETLIEDGKLKLDSEDLSQKFKSGIPHFYGFRTIDVIMD